MANELADIDLAFRKVNVKDEAKLVKHIDLASCVFLRGASDYKSIKRTIVHYVRSRETFSQAYI